MILSVEALDLKFFVVWNANEIIKYEFQIVKNSKNSCQGATPPSFNIQSLAIAPRTSPMDSLLLHSMRSDCG